MLGSQSREEPRSWEDRQPLGHVTFSLARLPKSVWTLVTLFILIVGFSLFSIFLGSLLVYSSVVSRT